VNLPDGGQTTWSYNDVAPMSMTRTQKQNSSSNIVSVEIHDGLGRISQTQLTSDTSTDFVDITYDVAGRKATVSNPYRSTGDSTYGISTYLYDALNRPTKVIPPDGSSGSNNVTTQYCGNSTLVTDQAGKWRRSLTDALGRLTEVDEPNSTTATV